MSQVNLKTYDNSWFDPGRGAMWRSLWFFLGSPLVRCTLVTSSSFRTAILRIFGARIGKGVVMRHSINVKYPWNLIVGDNSWFGEECWIDNLTTVVIGKSVCLSQGAYLCTGNHDWSDPAFGLMIAPIHLQDGSWAGAKCILTPGVVLGRDAVAGAGSVVTGNIPEAAIFAGNPAVFVKRRIVRDARNSARETEFAG